MIKRLRFTAATPPAADGDAVRALGAALEAGLGAGDAVRPLRTVWCTALGELIPGQRHDAVGIEWFSDAEHARRFEEWSVTEGLLRPIATRDGGPTIAVAEVVLRGQDWIERRWREGGEALKHMAIARRAIGLTPDDFSRRWQGRAGTVRAPGGTAVVAIPDEARGNAYVQNHPLPRAEGEWAYDAINEVYFETLDGLRRRISWFDETLDGGTEDDLVSEHSFLAVREVVLGPG